MEIKEKEIPTGGIKFSVEEDGKEVGHAYLFFIKNSQREDPFGFMEDVYVDESQRGKGLGTKLVNHLIEQAKKHGCYKIVGTSRDSRPKVHKLYEKLGFANYGRSFKIYFK